MPATVIIFDLLLLLTLAGVSLTFRHYRRYFRLLKPAFPVRDLGRRLWITVKVALGQSKILQRPVVGLLHALLFWGFLIILLGTLEMVADGITGAEKTLSGCGCYALFTAVVDVLALLIAVITVVFLLRRDLFRVPRFEGPEMTGKSHRDANITLVLILLLMITLTAMNVFYIAGGGEAGSYPFAEWLAARLKIPADHDSMMTGYHICWWIHILTIFVFANYLPYSKHFHVYLSLPNVFLSRLWPLGRMPEMAAVTTEVKAMMSGEEPPATETGMPRLGIRDVEDVTRKNYLESLTCTQCGRCTSVCPVNLTGGPLSPRKVMMNVRERMDEKGPSLVRGETLPEDKPLTGAYITDEELWGCVMCNACVRECPLNIHQPELLLGMRRYRVLEEGGAPPEWNAVYTNIENNGALWKMPATDRMRWAGELTLLRDGKEEPVEVAVMASLAAAGKKPEYLLWTGSAGAFDPRYRKVLRDFVRILAYLKIDFAVLGEEEISSGDFARRTGNEMLFVMQALQNIEIFKSYGIDKILTCDPHVYNTFRNEYPDLGEMPEVIHHSQFLEEMIRTGRLVIPEEKQKREQVVTYHDPCYLGRINGEYEAPRKVLQALGMTLREMPRHKATALCCGGGGGQMFREKKSTGAEIFVERTREALATGAGTIISACPYCMTMLGDGIKYEHAEERLTNKDLTELVAEILQITPKL